MAPEKKTKKSKSTQYKIVSYVPDTTFEIRIIQPSGFHVGYGYEPTSS
jgi:hypothetical protein